MLKVYHNPRCKKSRTGLSFLKTKTLDFEVLDYLKIGLTAETIREIILKTNLKPADLIRKEDPFYKKDFKNKSFTEDEWIKIIIENPKLLRRPVIVGKHKAIIGDSEEKIDSILL